MEIAVQVMAGSNKSLVVRERGKYRLYVKSDARGNRANLEVLGMLAKEFSVPIRSVKIVSGKKSKFKKIEIHENIAA